MIVNLRAAELPQRDDEGHRFRRLFLGEPAGAERTGFAVYELAPGEKAWPYHYELSEEEWRDMLVDAGLEIERVEYFEKTHETEDWLARTECTGQTAERVRELLAPLSDDGGRTWHDTKLIVKARKSQK